MSNVSVHPAAAAGFTSSHTDQYERGRPEHSLESVRVLLDKVKFPGSQEQCAVLELGAGTGKFTRSLQTALKTAKTKIIASEPLDGMRERLIATVDEDIDVLACAAENIPLADETVDLVIAAQAFHWFANDVALQEIHRVLKPDGHLALIWNNRDTEIAWIAELDKIFDSYYGKDVPRQQTMKWKEMLDAFNGFDALKSVVLRNTHQTGPLQMVLDRILSVSVIASQSEEEKRIVADKVASLLESHPDTKGLTTYTLSYHTDIYWCKKTAIVT
ncbi:uncharacterized protein LOC134186960 [Corticium candelabrum]|uniref:uncharacterized protein LOC134186960 n=1 Tax=Corticium candelabrum TaxID=121492 RepID=UPI002E27241F|nr:uncharacterized protein LOC134186960 [Corticium candelabrum]